MHPVKPSQPINELNQYVVHVTGRYHSVEHIAIARDEGTGLHVIGSHSSNFPVFYGSSPVGTVCNARAALTVRGNLLLCGERIRPEDYLSIWRARKPVSIEDLAAFYGIRLKARLELNMAAESTGKWTRTIRETGPQSFHEYCIAYGVGTSGQQEILIDGPEVFADLVTLEENFVRDKETDYQPLSRIHLIAEDVGGISTVANVAQPICVQLELV